MDVVRRAEGDERPVLELEDPLIDIWVMLRASASFNLQKYILRHVYSLRLHLYEL